VTKFERYKRLKALLTTSSCNDYPLDKVLGSYLAHFVWLKNTSKLRFFVYCLRTSYSVAVTTNILITYQSPRPSYKKFLLDYANIKGIDPNSITPIQSETRTTREIAAFIYRYFRFFKSYKSQTMFESLLLNFLTTLADAIITQLESKELTCTKQIAFNSSYLFESFLSYYFRKRAIPTFSLQHGMYFRYLNQIPLDVINYENICAENFLSWGEFSTTEIKPYLPNDVKIIQDLYPQPKITHATKKSEKILILLPRDIYIKEISSLLSILCNDPTEVTFLVRPHPTARRMVAKICSLHNSLELDAEESLYNTLTKYDYKYCVGFNTTALYEAGLHNQKLVQFISSNDEFIIEDIAKFSNINDYLKIRTLDLAKPFDKHYYFGLS